MLRGRAQQERELRLPGTALQLLADLAQGSVTRARAGNACCTRPCTCAQFGDAAFKPPCLQLQAADPHRGGDGGPFDGAAPRSGHGARAGPALHSSLVRHRRQPRSRGPVQRACHGATRAESRRSRRSAPVWRSPARARACTPGMSAPDAPTPGCQRRRHARPRSPWRLYPRGKHPGRHVRARDRMDLHVIGAGAQRNRLPASRSSRRVCAAAIAAAAQGRCRQATTFHQRLRPFRLFAGDPGQADIPVRGAPPWATSSASASPRASSSTAPAAATFRRAGVSGGKGAAASAMSPGCTKAVTRAPVQARQLGKAARRGRSQPGLALAQRIGQRRVGREQAQGRQQDADLRHQAPSLDQHLGPRLRAARQQRLERHHRRPQPRGASRNQLLCTATRADCPVARAGSTGWRNRLVANHMPASRWATSAFACSSDRSGTRAAITSAGRCSR